MEGNQMRDREREILYLDEREFADAKKPIAIAVEPPHERAVPAIDDVLLRNIPLPLRVVFYPMGFPVEVVTNSVEVLAAAEESWGHFIQVFSQRTVELRFGVIDAVSTECPPEVTYRAHRNLRSMIADQDNFCICDLTQGFAFGWLTRAAIEHHNYFRYYFLEAAASFFLITSPCVTLIHAACVKMAGHGVLLCGDSGAGKSSLAFACARAGWTYLSDDLVLLVQGGEDHVVVGNPHMFRFRDSAVELFPELKGEKITPHTVSKPTIEFPSERLSEITIADRCSVSYIVFLNRRDPDQTCLISYPREIALQWFEQGIDTNELRGARLAAIHNLLNVEILELRYSGLECAVNELQKLVVKDI
jgi:HPr Serine kinase C-terminal domain